MGKKNNHSSPAAAASSETEAIDKLKKLNGQLVKEVAECRKQIEQLQFQLAALASHHNILAGSEHKVSSMAERQREAAAQDNAEMAVKKTESAAAQLDAEEMLLLALIREKDEIQSNMEPIIADKDCAIWCLEQSRKKSEEVEQAGGRKWKRWICSAIVATASFCVAAAVVTLWCPKSSNPKDYL